MNYRSSSTHNGVIAQQIHHKWKYCKMTMHLIHLIYQISQLSLACPKHAHNTYISLELGKIIQHKAYFIIKCWTAHVTHGIMHGKWKVIWVQNGCKGIDGLPSWSHHCELSGSAHCHCPASQKYHTAYRIQNLRYGLYWMVLLSHHGEVEKS